MTEKKTPAPEAPTKGRSGEHQAVKTFREKMESISDEEGMTAGGLKALDAKLESFLEESRSIHPPASTSEPPVQTPCEPEPYSSRVCIRGTKGCNVAHELEDTKATKRLTRVAADLLCPHGMPAAACSTCTPRA